MSRMRRVDNKAGSKHKNMGERYILSTEQEDALMEAARDNYFYPVIRIISLSGMRTREVLGLTWDNVDFDKEEIRVVHTLSELPGQGFSLCPPKSKASLRKIPMSKGAELYRLLKKRYKEQQSQMLHAGKHWTPEEGLEQLVFTTLEGHPICRKTVRNALNGILEDMKTTGNDINKCTLESLRHCFAIRCIRSGMDPKTLQAVMGYEALPGMLGLYWHHNDAI